MRQQMISRMWLAVQTHRLLLSIVALYYAAAYFAASAWGGATAVPWEPSALLLLVLFGLTIRIAYVGFVQRPERLLRYLATDAVTYLTPERCLSVAIVLVILPIQTKSFLVYKCLIHPIQPRWWDAEIAELDRLVHFGSHPWEHLHAFLATPLATVLLDFCYILIFPVMVCVIAWHAFDDCTSKNRMQFLLTYVLMWILLGNAMAAICASVGPCYLDQQAGTYQHYQPLMAYLQAINEHSPLHAIRVQDLLWRGYTEQPLAFSHGVSAMPSLHVAIAYLLALSSWKKNRLLGWFFAVFTVIIMIGSVHLGWHYAIDGYVSILGVWLIWRSVGWILQQDPIFRNGRKITPVFGFC